jgi:hypothetical protein
MGVPDSLDRTADVVRDLCAAPVTYVEVLAIMNDCCDTDKAFLDSVLAFKSVANRGVSWPFGDTKTPAVAEVLLREAAKKARGQ